jgi:hypothetical protein
MYTIGKLVTGKRRKPLTTYQVDENKHLAQGQKRNAINMRIHP